MKKEHKKSELWVFYVGCYLDIRNRLLGTSRFKGTKGKGKVVWASTLGPLVSFLGAKRVQPRFVKVKGLGQVRPGFKPGIGSSSIGQRAAGVAFGNSRLLKPFLTLRPGSKQERHRSKGRRRALEGRDTHCQL